MNIQTPLKYFSAAALTIGFTLANAQTVLNSLPSTLQTHAKQVSIHLNGESGFIKKLDLIKRAKPSTTIQLAYFIFESDYTASALAKALVEKAQSGNKVQLLVDYYMSESYMAWLANMASNPNFEVKRFRPPSPQFLAFLKNDLQIADPESFVKALMKGDKNLILQAAMTSPILAKHAAELQVAMSSSSEASVANVALLLAQFKDLEPSMAVKFRFYMTDFTKRLHHKLLIAETDKGTEFMVGGRNISDEYHASVGHEFLKGRNYPFFDSEVSGTMDAKASAELKNSFAKLWMSTVLTDKVVGAFSAEENSKMLNNTEKFNAQLESYKATAIKGSLPIGDYDMIYTENSPSSVSLTKEISRSWIKLIEKSEKQIDIVSAYFFLTDDMLKALKKAAARNVKINIKTNSFSSTDMNIVNIAAYKHFARWTSEVGPNLSIAELQKGKGEGSLHAKIINVDNKYVGIGSANTDPRTHLHDTNNLVVLDLSKNTAIAKKIFDAYLSPVGLLKLKWAPVTEPMAKMIYEKAISEKKGLREALELSDFIDQL
ncbi:phosphatidylserine/phosphatidylglycerophosphate/cardiolipin synthase family protein [bacterium]|nr:phosphatidylserine/phosphatidylglycerophosphate/cardiolipin synthase family protein [bacterium]